MNREQEKLTVQLWNMYQATLRIQRKRRSRIRRLLAEVSIENFIRIYFPHKFSYTPKDIKKMGLDRYGVKNPEQYGDVVMFNPSSIGAFEIFDRIVKNDIPENYCIVKPRGFGKSTEIEAFAAYCIAMKSHKYILYISKNAALSDKMLDNLKKAAIGNALLAEDFPEFTPKKHFNRNMYENFSRKLVAYQNTYVEGGYSSKVAIRGTNIGGLRPDLIIIDDIDSREDCQSPKKRQDLEAWFEQDIVRLGGNINPSIIMAGTIFHDDALISKVAIKKKYEDFTNNIMVFPAIDKQGESLWPEIWPLERLEDEKRKWGSFMFASEFMCDPVPAGDVMFDINHIRKFSFTDPPQELDPFRLHCFVDIATGIKTSNDFTAVIVVYQDENGIFYVLDASVFRKTLFELETFLMDHQKKWGYRKLGLESNNREDFIKRVQDRFWGEKNFTVTVKGIRHTTNKELRIQTQLQSLIESGLLRFYTDYDKQYSELIEQLIRFPVGSHDDAPDALAGCIELYGARKYKQAIKSVGYADNKEKLILKKQEETMLTETFIALAKDDQIDWKDGRDIRVDHVKTVRIVADYEGTRIQYIKRNDGKENVSYYRDGFWNQFSYGGDEDHFFNIIKNSISRKLNGAFKLREINSDKDLVKVNGANGSKNNRSTMVVDTEVATDGNKVESKEISKEPTKAKPTRRPAGKARAKRKTKVNTDKTEG